jgi:FAD/FMN-containing dehydrogenase
MIAFNPLGISSRPGTLDRRQFLGAAAATAAVAVLPARRSWADAASAGAIPDSLVAVGSTGKPVTLTAADIKDFRASLRGQLLLTRDESYDQVRRVWNGAFDRHPALIARCTSAADVVQAVNFARAHNLLSSVRGGGHSISGQSACDGGLMIDLALMTDIQLDQTQHIAQAQPGVLLGDLDAKCQAVGLVTPLGTASDTGIAGLTLGGGQGRLMRKLGLSCDNVRSFEIVTANGKLMKASAEENPDLYWALRGGGGNFGVVTRFEYQLHPLKHQVLAGVLLYPFSQAHTVLPALLDFAARAPDELYLTGGLVNVAPKPGGSAPGALLPGRYVAIEAVYSDDPGKGERVLEPLAKFGKPAAGKIVAKSYVDAQNGFTGASPPALPAGLGVYIKSGFVNSFPEKLIGEIIDAFEGGPEWLDHIGFGQCAGAVARIKPDATAYWNREAQWDLLLAGAWADHSQDQHNAAVLRDVWKRFEPYTKGYYVNTEPSADEQRLRATYGDNYPRLVQVKNKYDPTNLFHLNANIKPTAPA